jgi:hypothetical protein
VTAIPRRYGVPKMTTSRSSVVASTSSGFCQTYNYCFKYTRSTKRSLDVYTAT